jgi:hypothetical protein
VNSLLKPEDLHALGQCGHSIFLKVYVEIVLVYVELHILVKSEVSSITVILEGLNFGHD